MFSTVSGEFFQQYAMVRMWSFSILTASLALNNFIIHSSCILFYQEMSETAHVMILSARSRE